MRPFSSSLILLDTSCTLKPSKYPQYLLKITKIVNFFCTKSETKFTNLFNINELNSGTIFAFKKNDVRIKRKRENEDQT